jgi:hypothetical protein
LDLVEQSGVDTAMQHRGGAQCELALVVLGLGVRDPSGR